MNTELRKLAKDNFEKDLFKLMNNAVFGKTMENIRKHRDIKLVTIDKKRNKLVSEPNYHTINYISEDLSITEMNKTRVKMKNNDDGNDEDMPDLETEAEAAERIAKKESKISDDNDKVFDVLNKFNYKMENDMRNLDKVVTDKENKWSTKLDKLNNDVKKLDNYIKEDNDKKINTEKKLDNAKNKYNKLLLEYNQSNEELNRTKNELYGTKNKLNKSGNDINAKAKYTDELKEIQEKFDYQNVKDLENENREMINKSEKNFEIINKKHNQEIEKLEKEPKKKKNILMNMKKIELKNKKKLIN